MNQRPSLFNFTTELIAQNLIQGIDLMCKPIAVAADVKNSDNPIIAVESPITIPGTSYGLGWCFQVTDIEIDFHPGNVLNLPSELNSLPEQCIAIHGAGCYGIGCPDKEILERVLLTPPFESSDPKKIEELPTKKIECFCIDFYAIAHIEIIEDKQKGTQVLTAKLDGFEISDLKPDGLENSIECLMKMGIQIGGLSKIRIAVSDLVFNILNTLKAILSPISNEIPHNPAIEENQFKVFIDLGVVGT